MTDSMIGEYLDLLGCGDCLKPDYENLCRLQRAHLEKIPYNNLEILAGRVPALDTESLFDKMIRRKQGGYCFELNGLFAELLRDLGYEVKEYFARWHFGGNDAVPMRRHRVIEVTVAGKVYIADAGIGSAGSVMPFELVFDEIQERPVRNYRFVRDEALGILLQAETDGGWVPYYSFTPDPHFARGFEYANFYCAKHPESVFRKKFFMHRQTETEQYYVEDLLQPGTPLHFCIRKSKTEVEKTSIENPQMLAEILEKYFSLCCEPEALTNIPALKEISH